MKKSIFNAIFLIGFTSLAFGQDKTTTQASLPDLNGVTFGFGAGYNWSFDRTYDYSLTTDASHSLKMQPLSKGAFVISSVIMVKLGKLAVDPGNNTLVKQSNKTAYAYIKQSNYDQEVALKAQMDSLNISPKNKAEKADKKTKLASIKTNLDGLQSRFKSSSGVCFVDRLSVNLALDLANVAPNVSFNKNVSGGLGLGYYLNDYVQVALFYDVTTISQLRDYVVANYQDKPIPNGTGTNYSSLSTTDNNLFYNKTVSGLSFKLIFSLANKKSPATP